MMKLHFQIRSGWVRASVLIGLSMLLLSCLSPAIGESSNRDWISLSVFIDGIMKVEVSLPPPDSSVPSPKSQLITSEANKSTQMFVEGYDPGRGKYKYINSVHITGRVTRIEKEDFITSSIDFEDIKHTLYFSRPEIQGDYEIVGAELIGSDEWLRVNFVGESPRRGIAYFRPVYGKYAIMISMRMYGKQSDETKLYKERHEDLKKVLQSVQVTIEDFELERARQQ